MSPQMIERAEAAGIPKENIILAGSDEQKVKIVKDNNISKHIDNKESVIKALGKTGELFDPGKYPDLKADFIDMDLSDEDLNQLKKGGFIIDQYPDGGTTTPEEWQKAIRSIEQQIGSPDQWTLESYNLLQNKLNEYKNWRENTPEGKAVRDSHNVEGEYNVPLPQHLQNYTNGMMKARIAYANEFGNPAAKRMIVAPDQPYDFGNGMIGTHYMASMDDYSVPQIQDVNGQLVLGDYGPDSAEAIKFDNPEDAQYFAAHYKDVSPAFLNEKKKGGIIKYPDGGQPRPVQGMAKPLAPLVIRQEQVKPLKNSPKVADQKKYKAVQDEVKAKESIQKASKQLDELQKNALPQHEQPLVAQDWIWTLPMMGGSAMKSAGTAIADGVGALGTKAMPYITGALETSLPFMKSIPGATVGNAIASGFATDAIVNRLPEGVTQLNNGQYIDATGNILTGLLDVAGAGMMSPLYQGAKSTASELARFLGTEEGLLSNTYKVNPFAFEPKSNAYYRMIGEEGYADALNTGVVRPPQTTRIFDQSSQKYVDIPIPQFDEAYYNAQYPLDRRWYPNSIKKTNPEKAINAKKAGYKGPYMAEVTGDSHLFEKGENVAAYTGPNSFQTVTYSKEHIPITNTNLKFYKEHWLHGYKEVPRELPGSPNSEIPQINPLTGLLQVNNTTALSTVLPRTFKETYIPGYKSAEGLSEDMLPYLLPQEELMTRAPWRYLSKDQEIMNSYKSSNNVRPIPYEIPAAHTTQEDIWARALGKPLPERVSRASLEPKIYYDIDGNVIDDPLKSGFDGNFLTRPLTPFTKNELTTLPNKNLKYRKIGNKAGLQDLINKGGAQAPAPMRMKSGLTADTPFFGMGKKPSEDYKGIFAVELKPDNSKYNWSSRVAGTDNYGVAPFDKVTGRSIKNVPLEDLNVYRKKFLSNNYKKLDPNNLEEGLKYAQAQVLAEQAYKWGIRGVTADQIFNDGNYRKQIQDAISDKLMTYKKNGGFMNSSTLNKFIR
jgi:hypothetical protein